LISRDRDEKIHGPRIEDCIKKFLAAHKTGVGDRTQAQYERLLARFQTYASARGVYTMHELTVDLCESFKTEGLPDYADTTLAWVTGQFRYFLREAFRRGWTKEHLAEKVRRHQASFESKEPFTNEEVEKILKEAGELPKALHGFASQPQTFRLLLELMLATGMRVSDALRYDPRLVRKSQFLWVYQFVPTKTKRKVAHVNTLEAYIPDALKTAIDQCVWFSPELPFRSKKNWYDLAIYVWKLMQRIGERCGVADCRPHRLRDTFAVRKLLHGLQLDDVARLLGHSSVKVTETYYARWIPARKLRLERLVAESMMDPQGNRLGNG
jgi:site-specific recombinase XerD